MTNIAGRNGLAQEDRCDELPAAFQRITCGRHAGHVPGAHHISSGELPGQLEAVPRDKPVAVYCGSGYHSSVAASLLRRSGHRYVYNVIGGFSAWAAKQLPVEGD